MTFSNAVPAANEKLSVSVLQIAYKLLSVSRSCYVRTDMSNKAKEIAGGLVSNKLAACVNIIPGVTSVYEWEGKIENDSEVLMMIKTRSARIGEMTEFVKSKSKSQHQLRKLMRLNCCCFFCRKSSL